jgi:hypothetical protein
MVNLKANGARGKKVAEAVRNGLALLAEAGEWKASGQINLLMAGVQGVMVAHRTPFQKIKIEPRMLAALKAAGREPLPYVLDVWADQRKVMNVEWNDTGDFRVASYRPGSWEVLLAGYKSPEQDEA